MSEHVQTFTDANWKAEVSEAEGLVLVDFWAVWCPPCRMIAPAVESLAAKYEGRVKVGKLNVDENPEVAEAFAIRSIPTLLVLWKGEVVDMQVGAVPESHIAAMIEGQLRQSEEATTA